MTNKDLSPAKRALLAKWLQGGVQEPPKGVPKRPADRPPVLSFPQQRQLFLELLERSTAVNNLSCRLDVQGPLDLKILEESANRIVARHEVLRTRFPLSTTLPVPEILPEVSWTLNIVDLTAKSEGDQRAEARHLAEQSVLQPFNLTQAPLVRLSIYRLGTEHFQLLLTVHHMIADGWSLGVFLNELVQCYRQLIRQETPQLPILPLQYADFAHWQTQNRQAGQLPDDLTYWKAQLGGPLPVLELPTDRARQSRQTFSGGTYRFVVSPELTGAVEALSRDEDATVYMTFLTAFYILLHRYSGQNDLLVGTPVANRNLPELQGLIGVFINTLVLRTDLSGNPSFRTLLGRVRRVALDAYAHQDLPFEQLVEALKPQRDLSRTPLFQVVFNLQNSPMPRLDIPGLKMEFLDIDRGVSQFDLTLMMTRRGNAYDAVVEFNQGLFRKETIGDMFQAYQLLLAAALAQPDTAITQLPLLSAQERTRRIFERNQTQLDLPAAAGMHQLFEARAARTPEAIAVSCADISLTYAELNRRANLRAGHLLSQGVTSGTRVGVLLERSVRMVEVLLAIHKAGGCYVPLHPDFPMARISYMLKDAGVHLLLTDQQELEITGAKVVIITAVDLDHEHKIVDLPPPPAPQDLAYIIYTSGSTGQPKGVMVPHRALVNFLWSMRTRPGLAPEDTLLAVTSLSFDIAALELFLPLIVGARLIIADRAMLENPLLLSRAIIDQQVSVMQATPATWQLLLRSGWAGHSGLKALCGGDVMTRNLADQLLRCVDSLWNMYGPTETTIWSSVGRIDPGNQPITIGQPIANTQLYILDGEQQAVPTGVVGELYIGGTGVARGYLNRPELTTERFIPDPFQSRAGARLYRTGDLARYLPDDSIELLGRKDDQVKINGHRIELGEITAILVEHPAVQEAIVVVRQERAKEKRLVAYLVPVPGLEITPEDIRIYLKQSLPSYMIPALFVEMAKMPLTSSGKIDRSALPDPGADRQSLGYVAPKRETERILCNIWQTALEVPQVSIHDNFFELGGASIQSLEIVARANMFGFKIGIEQVFEYQTVAELAKYIDHSA